MNKWDLRFARLAREVSSWSKDPSRQIGAVAVDNHRRILATGYNGFPKGILDTPERLNDRPTKYKYVVHAEMNCIYNAAANGVSLEGATLYVHGLPVCHECAKGVISVCIRRVIMSHDVDVPMNWGDSFKNTVQMFNEVGVDWRWDKIEY